MPDLETEPDVTKTEGKDPPKDGREWIPRERFNEATGKLKSRHDAIAAELEATRAENARLKQAAENPPVTRAQLDEAVRKGQITEDQAEARWEAQVAERAATKATETVRAENRAEKQLSKIETELLRYREAIPEILHDGSSERAKVQKEYQYLLEVLGEPDSLVTEVKALRMAFGPPERIQELTRERRETQQESGGGGSGRTDPPKKLGITARQRQHYEHGIAAGRYSGWNDPFLVKELEYAKRRKTAGGAAD